MSCTPHPHPYSNPSTHTHSTLSPHSSSSPQSPDPPYSPYSPPLAALNTYSPSPDQAALRGDRDRGHHTDPHRQSAGTTTDNALKRPNQPQSDTARVDQLVQHFYNKTLAVLSHARLTHPVESEPSSSAATGSTSSVSTVAGGLLPGGGVSRRASSTGVGGADGRKNGKGKVNKWFNLELPDSPIHRDELKTWRSVSTLLSASGGPSPSSSVPFSSSPSPSPASASVPPMVLETLLDVSDLTPNQVLVLQSSSASSPSPSRRIRVNPSLAKPSTSPPPTSSPRGVRSPLGSGGPGSAAISSSGAPPVVLERWVLRFLPPPPSRSSTRSQNQLNEDLPLTYKRSILHFRSLYTLVRALPSYALHRNLARRRAGVGGAGLKIGVRMRVGERAEGEGDGEGEVGLETRIEGDEEGDEGTRETEGITFPGVVTSLGTLSLTCMYRLNAAFSVEEIETLLSSRFIDEDFFRPTVMRYKNPEDVARPGSLPISSRMAIAASAGTNSPAKASPPAGIAAQQPGITGLAPLPSYGSLSSRHQYAPHHSSSHFPHPPSPLSTSPAQRPPAPIGSPLPAPLPLPGPSPGLASSPLSTSTSSRFSSYAPPGTSTGGVIEPAFISLSRARGASYTGSTVAGTTGTGIQRASPLSSSPVPQVPRRTSLTSSSAGASSGSPIFRPGSYIASAPQGGLSCSPSYSTVGYGPISRQQPFSTGTSGSPSPNQQLQFGARSPLAPAVPHVGPSNLGATAPSSSSLAGVGVGVGVGIAIGGGGGPGPGPGGAGAVAVPIGGGGGGGGGGSGGTPSSSSFGRGGGGGGAGPFAFPFGSTGTGSYTSRSFGRGSSSGGEAAGWGGPESYASGGGGAGGPIGAPGLQRRASSRLSFGASSSGTPGIGAGMGSLGRSSRLSQLASAAAGQEAHEGSRKKFVNEGRPPEDKDEIEAFLSLLDSKPDLRGSTMMAGGSSRYGGGSVLASKKDVDEQMRQLRSSVFGGGEGSSPPSFTVAAPTPPRVGPSGLSGISSLRKQTSRLSIEEDSAGEAAAAVARERGRSPSGSGGEGEKQQQEQQQPSSRQPYRPLSLGRRNSAISPTLSATSSSTARPPPLPPLSLDGGAARFSSSSVEPRFLPLPLSAATSPLASPGLSRERDTHSTVPHSLAQQQPYPPLPYPPAATTTTSTSTEPITFAPSLYASPLTRGVRQPLLPTPSHIPLPSSSNGFTPSPSSPSPSPSPALASSSSFLASSLDIDVETDVEAALSTYHHSYSQEGEEVEAVGRLELDDSPSALLAAQEERGRQARAGLSLESGSENGSGGEEGEGGGGGGGEERRGRRREEALAEAAQRAQEVASSRDSTPAAHRGVGYFGAHPMGSRRRRSGSRNDNGNEGEGERRSPPEISWMG
ncbi:hypothetical protein JCM11641_005734 [Rhodosporidiobolus odoratus]